MFLAKVEGTLVATKKDPAMSGRKLLLVRPQLVDEKDPTKFRPGQNTIVAVDSLGCGEGEMVLFCQGSSARHWIGSYFLQLNGADAIVFTAGTGENRAELRAAICASLENLGIKLDAEKNNSTRATEAVISAADSAVKIFVIPTNEELVVARETKRFLESKTS